MNIRGSRYRLARIATRDPEEIAFEQRQAESRDRIERLKEERAEFARTIAQLKAKSEALGRARIAQLKRERDEFQRTIERLDPDWLCYLPSAAGSPEFIARSCEYLENFRGRIETAGKKVWLCKDHDFVTLVAEVLEFRVFNGAVFCSVQWSDRKFRETFKGVSADNAVFMGDPDLLLEKKTPACRTMDDLPAEVQTAAQSDAVFGLAGAACCSFPPAYGVTGIYRLGTNNTLTTAK